MNYNLLNDRIKNSILSGDYDSLSDNLDLGYNVFPKSNKFKSTIYFGYQILADHYKSINPEKAIIALDRKRRAFPDDIELLKEEVEYLINIINKNIDILGKDDFEVCDHILKIIRQTQRIKNTSRDLDLILNPIESFIISKINEFKNKSSSMQLPLLNTMLFSLFADLTQKERDEMIATIINETIIDIKKLEEEDKRRKKLKKEFKDSP